MSALPSSTLFSALAISYIFVVVIYRLYYHPLARLPGPFWARISGFPSYWHTLKRDRHVWFWSLQEKYGPTFRFGPNSALVNTPTGLKTIFHNKANVRKAEYYKLYPRKVEAVTTWNSIDKDVHARKRRVLNNAFSDKAMRNAEPFIHSNVDRWCELLRQQAEGPEWSGSLNMARWVDYLVFDILGDLCFGRSFNMKEQDSKLRHVPELMISFLSVLHPIAFSPFAGFWVWLKPRGLNRLLAICAPPALKSWEMFVERCLSDRTKVEQELQNSSKPASQGRKDFFHYLFNAVDADNKPGFSKDELWGESESLIIAGADTTAITTAAALFYLTCNPEVQARLVEELTSAFPSLESIKGGMTLYSCRYLRAFIQETLRMSPPVPADLSREVLKEGLVVDGQFFPPGVNISTAIYCLHHDKNIYPEPFKFQPERWIHDENDKATAERVALAESAFCAFSAGPRACIGKNLAYLELSLILAKIIYQFELRREPKSNLGGGSPDAREGRRVVDQYQVYDIFVGIRDGPMVQVKSRIHA